MVLLFLNEIKKIGTCLLDLRGGSGYLRATAHRRLIPAFALSPQMSLGFLARTLDHGME
jgi:hypothetical protein